MSADRGKGAQLSSVIKNHYTSLVEVKKTRLAFWNVAAFCCEHFYKLDRGHDGIKESRKAKRQSPKPQRGTHAGDEVRYELAPRRCGLLCSNGLCDVAHIRLAILCGNFLDLRLGGLLLRGRKLREFLVEEALLAHAGVVN